MTIKRAVAGLVGLVTLYFLITLGWDFPFARAFMLIIAGLLYVIYQQEGRMMKLEDAVNYNAAVALTLAKSKGITLDIDDAYTTKVTDGAE